MKNIKIEALLNGMLENPVWEINSAESQKVLNTFDSLPAGNFVNRTKDYNRFYNGCMLETSAGKNIHVFDGYAIINENNIIEVRVDKNKKLEKLLLKSLKTAPAIRSLIFNSELPADTEIHKAI